jgi:MFS family permease
VGGWGGTSVLRNRDAGLYLAGVVVSGFGSSAMALAAGVWVKSLTGSDSLAALTTFCVWAPILLGPLIGTLADRTRRRPLLIRANLIMAVVLLTLPAVRSAEWIWLLFAVLTVYGVSSVLTDAAEAALIVSVLPGELRGDFNGLRLTANEGMKIVAPLLGAGLFVQFGGPAVALLAAVTFVLAAGAFALIRVEEPVPRTETRRRWARQVADGIRWLSRQRELRSLVGAGALTMFVAGVNGAAVYAVVDSGLGRPPAFAGVLYAVQGVGSVGIGVVAGALLRRLPERTFAAIGIALFAAGVALRAAPSVPLALTASAMIGAGLPCALIASMTAVQREAPEYLLGRVAATANTVLFAPNALALGAGAGLVALVDHEVLLLCAGTTAVAAALCCLLRPGLPRRRAVGARPAGDRSGDGKPPTRQAG